MDSTKSPFIEVSMDPKSGLRPYLQRDVDDIIEALVDDEGNVASQITIMVNGRERLVNVGLITNTAGFIWGRGEPKSMQETIESMCYLAFNNYDKPLDHISGYGKVPRKLISAGLTKREDVLVGSLIYRRELNGRLYGDEVRMHYVSDHLTKYQQVRLMHLLLAHGEDGHVGHGMRDWDLWCNLVSGHNTFELRS